MDNPFINSDSVKVVHQEVTAEEGTPIVMEQELDNEIIGDTEIVDEEDDIDDDDVVVAAPEENKDNPAPEENKDNPAPEENKDNPAPEENKDNPAPEENKDNPAPEEQPEPVPETQPELTVEDVITKFDKKDILKALALDDFAIDAVEYYQRTGDMTPYLEVKSVDYSKVSDEDLMKQKLREQYAEAGLSREELEEVVTDEWYETLTRLKLDPETFSESEAKIGKLKLKAEVAAYRNQKVEQQKNFSPPPKEEVSAPSVDEQVEAAKKVVVGMPEVQEFTKTKKILLGSKDAAYNYEVANPEETISLITDNRKYTEHIAKRNAKGEIERDRQGNVVMDYNKMLRIAAYVQNPEAYDKSLINHGKSLGAKKIEEKLENPRDNKTRGSEPEEGSFWKAVASNGVWK